VKKFIVVGAGSAAIAAAAASTALFGAGIAAAAPDVVGMEWGDAQSTIEDEGGTPVVAVRYGSHAESDECLVTGAWDAPFMRDVGDAFEHADSEVLVALNCDGSYASAVNPGPSALSPEARAAKAAEEEAAAAEEEELAEVSTPDE
jgi:hypothetical protein